MMIVATSGSLNNFLQLLFSILIFIFVLAITYFVTRWIGSYQKKQNENRNIQVIETMRVANNKYIQIIRIAEVYLVVSICKDSMVTLARLEPEDIDKLQIADADNHVDSFQDIFKKIKISKK